METKKCRKCGAFYLDDMVQCPTCGKKNNTINSKTIAIEQPYRNHFELQQQKPVVICPYCTSSDTKKITSTEKVVNIALFGIFGNKRKHQWYCNNCKSNF